MIVSVHPTDTSLRSHSPHDVVQGLTTISRQMEQDSSSCSSPILRGETGLAGE